MLTVLIGILVSIVILLIFHYSKIILIIETIIILSILTFKYVELKIISYANNYLCNYYTNNNNCYTNNLRQQ